MSRDEQEDDTVEDTLEDMRDGRDGVEFQLQQARFDKWGKKQQVEMVRHLCKYPVLDNPERIMVIDMEFIEYSSEVVERYGTHDKALTWITGSPLNYLCDKWHDKRYMFWRNFSNPRHVRTFEQFVSLAEYHMRGKKPRCTVRLPMERTWAYRTPEG